MKKLVLLFSGLMMGAAVYAQPVTKVFTKITVAQDGSGDFKTIQEAVN
ncbi:MAG: pectin esterase, partial [Chitinophagaceae bacterium]|nr:pectin esterase [Chitinophagaceae bacterium]